MALLMFALGVTSAYAQSNCVAAPSGLVSWWRAEGNASDFIGTNNGSLVSGVTFSAGEVGQAFCFNGTSQYVQIPDSTSLRLTNGLTLECWFNSSNNYGNLIGKPVGSGYNDSYTLWVQSGALQGKICNSANQGPGLAKPMNFTPGIWYHAAYTYDPIAQTQALYLNGQLVASGSETTPVGYDSHPVQIGADNDNGGNDLFWGGQIDEPSIYNRALSATEIQSIYNAGSAGKCTQATPTVTWATPSSISYGMSLGTNQLDATANVPGTFVYSPPVGTVLNAGSNVLSVTYTPTDTIHYASTAGSITILISQDPLTVTANNASRTSTQSNPVFTGTITGLTNGDNITANYTCSAGPASPPGVYLTVPVLVDPNGRLGNYSVTIVNGSLTVTAGPAPSLQVTSITVPTEAWTGAAFDVSWTDTNSGPFAATGPWLDNVYLSPTNQFQITNSQLLGSFPFSANLAAGQAVKRTQPVTINRSGVTNGEFYVVVLADATGSVPGDSGANSPPGTSTNFNVYVTPLPDLVVSAVTAPSSGIGGQPVSVAWTVCNIGLGDTDLPLWYDQVYLSSTTNIANAIADYGQFANPSFLASGDCYQQSATVNLPVGYGGPFYFIVQANSTGALMEANSTNNFGNTVQPINIQLTQPGFLHVQSVQVVPAPPTSTWPGSQITCTYVVQNTGQSAITGTWDDQITLSSDSNYVNGLTTTFKYEVDIDNTGPLIPGSFYTNSGQFTLPSSVAGSNVIGTWYVIPVVDIHFAAGGHGFGTGNIGRDELSLPINVIAPPQADLVTTSVFAPTNALAGNSIQVQWTVFNQGIGATSGGFWYDAIYFSPTAVFNLTNATLLNTFGYWGGLALGAGYTNSASVTLPSNALGTNYIFVVSDAGSNIVEITLTNNVLGASTPLVISVNPPAQLFVSSVANPGTAVAGRSAMFSWTVVNNGAGATSSSNWIDSVYLSPSTNFNSSQAIFLGSAQHIGALNPGASYAQNQSFSIPVCDVGNYYIFVQADSANQVIEAAQNVAVVGGSPSVLRVFASPAANLQVHSVNAPASAIAGGSLTLNWTVLNSGNATTNAPWTDAIYLSQSPQFNPATAQLLGVATQTNNLGIGGSYAHSQTNPLPACLNGSYYIYIEADVYDTVNILACQTNNILRSTAPVSITPSPYANLQVSAIVLPTGATSGVPWVVQWTVTNSGTGAANQPWSDAVYASTQPTLDGSALPLGIFSYTNSVPPGSNYIQNQLVSLPSCLSGQYYVFVEPDLSNQVDSVACRSGAVARSTNSITISNLAYPDLQIANVGLPVSASAGQPMSISWSVTNSGSANATGPWTDSLYLSPTPTFTAASSVFVGAYNNANPLAPGATYIQNQSPLIPANVHGIYYLAVVTDSSNQVQECSGETNDSLVSAGTVQIPITIQPDLMVPTVTAPASAVAGQSIPVSWVVSNDGTAPTGGKVWYDTLYLSQDDLFDSTAVSLGSFPRIASLNVGAAYTNSVSVMLPNSASGPYYLFVVADSGGDLYDGYNEADNIGMTTNVMLVSLPSRLDLAVTNVTFSPSSGVPGTIATINWSVRNIGANSALPIWTDAIYVSTNSFWDLTAIPLGTHNHSGLAGNGSYSDSWTGPLPALTPGNYYAIVRTDVRNTLLETNLSNNTAASANTISVDVPILALGQTVTNQLSTGTQQYYKVSVPTGQTVLFNLTSAATNSANELYIRYGAVPDLGDYDFIFTNALAANQQIEIPTTQAGWYYVLVRGFDVPSAPATYSLTAQTMPFAITSVSPTNIGDNGQVTITLNGALFQQGATVQLVNGTNVYFAGTNFFINGTTVQARFFFTNAVHGKYDVVLTNSSGPSTILAGGLIIQPGISLQAQVLTGQVNLMPRQGASFNWNGFLQNNGNVDIQVVNVPIIINPSQQVVVNPPSAATPIYSEEGTTNGFLQFNLSPGSFSPFSFKITGYGSSSFQYLIEPIAEAEKDYLTQIAASAEFIRLNLLSSTSDEFLPTDVATALQDSTSWESFVGQQYVNAGLLDSNDLQLLPPANEVVTSTSKLSDFFNQQIPAPEACALVNDAALAGQLALALANQANCMVQGWKPLLQKTPLSVIESLSSEWNCLGSYQGSINKAVGLYKFGQKACNYLFPPTNNCGQGLSLADGSTLANVCPPASHDPNELIGPIGSANAAFISVQQASLYTVYFENESNVTAYARQVSITNLINPGFDVRSFRLGEIAIGNVTVTVPPNRTFYQTRVAAPAPNPTNIVVDVTAGIDIQNHEAFWTMNAIDLNTGQLVTSALEGVLPPDKTNQIGEGHVIYTILPNASDPTGTVVTNGAVIVFDNNEPIPTNPTTNTVDGVPPTSSVVALPTGTLTTNFTINWSGADDVGGSGLLEFDIYVSDDGSPFQVWQSATTATSAVYSGQYGHNYGFYSVSHDNAGNTETTPTAAQATIYVSTNIPPTLNPIPTQNVNFTTHFAVTNVATDSNGSGITLTYSLVDASPGVTIDPTNGILTWNPLPSQGGTTNLITVMVTDNGNPPLSTSQSFLAIVGDYTALSLPNTVVLAGQSGTEPFYFSSSASVTNMVFLLNYDTNRLTNWGITNFIAQVTAGSVSVVSPSVAQVNLSFGGGQLFHGTQAVAQLTFNTFSNRHSAFLPLNVSNLQVLNAASQPVTNDLIQNGRIAFVGIEPMLELLPAGSNIFPTLVLYGKPGSSYMTERKTNLLGGSGWQSGWRIPMSNVTENFSVDGSLPMAFYRAEEFFADPPILELSGAGTSNLSLLIYGKVGTNYFLQSNTNLADANSWLSQSNFKLTNSYLFSGAGGTTNPARFFRAKRP